MPHHCHKSNLLQAIERARMAPQEKESIRLLEEGDRATRVFYNDNAAPYIICNSNEQFVNPTVPLGTKPEDILQGLNLDLGQQVVNANSKTVLWLIKLIDSLFFERFESIFFNLWKMIPLAARRASSLFRILTFCLPSIGVSYTCEY
jgi:hypothetical protein